MNICGQFAGALLNTSLSLYNRATLTFYSGTPGTPPATVETAPTGSALASWEFPETAFLPLTFPVTIVGGKVVALSNNFTTPGQNPTTGTVAYARAFVWIWAQGVAVAPGSYAVSGGNLYVTAAGGTTGTLGLSGTTGTISDGTVSWIFVQAANAGMGGHAISDHSVNTSGADILVGVTNLVAGVTVTLTNIAIAIPAS